jgi:hypothetical protein
MKYPPAPANTIEDTRNPFAFLISGSVSGTFLIVGPVAPLLMVYPYNSIGFPKPSF